MFQQLQIIGHVGGEPIMRYMPDGTAQTTFSVATNKRTKNGEKTTWFRCSAWGKLAETVAEYVDKGNKVMVIGEVDTWPYTDRRSGEPRASLEVRANIVRFLDGKPRADGEAPTPEPAVVSEIQDLMQAHARAEEEIPF